MLIPTEAPPPFDQLLLLAERDPSAAVRRARQIWNQIKSADRLDQAWAEYTLGWALLRRQEIPDSLARLQQAQAQFQALGRPTLVLHCRRAELIARLFGGWTGELEQALDALAAEYHASELDLDAARTRMQQIGYLNVIGLPQAALALGDQITPLVRAQGTVDDYARLVRVLAVAAKQAGLLHQARDQLVEAAALFARLDYPVEVAKCLVEQAHIAEREGAFLEARQLLHDARARFQELELPFQVALCEKNLGIVASWLSELDQALAMTLQAHATFLECDQRAQAASCDLSLGNIAYYSGLFDLAHAAYGRAQTTYTDLGLQRLTLIARRNQALVMLAQGQFSSGYAQLCALELEVEALGDALELAEIYQAQAQALHNLQRNDAALERLAHTEQQLARLGRYVGVAECWLARGELYFDLGEIRAAEACLYAAQVALHDQPIYIWRVLHGLGRCAKISGAIQAALDHYQEASTIIARLRTTLVNEHASSALFAQAGQLYEDAIRLAADTEQTALVLLFTEQQRALTLQQRRGIGQLHLPPALAERYERQRQTIQTLMQTEASAAQLDAALTAYTDLLLQLIHSAPLPERLPPVPFDVEHLRAAWNEAFPKGWVVLSFVECGAELLIVAIDHADLTLTRTPIDVRVTRLLEQACHPRLRLSTFNDWPRSRDPSRQPWLGLVQLTELLLPATVRVRLQPDLRLLIVPSARLHNLPWAALRVDDAWLCERAIIQTLPALSWWQPDSVQAPPNNAALLIGCSDFGSRAQALPETMTELDQVAAIWPGPVTHLSNRLATRAALLQMAEQQQLTRYAVLHIASHAQLSAAQGLLAHIMLWDDDLLYDEVARLGLSSALVVLSTCDGSAGEVLPGDEVMSLSRAFLIAGARAVIANVWPSYDSVAPQLMHMLYSYLAAGSDAAQAVAQMQRELLTHGEDASGTAIMHSSPLVWGGFQVVGDGLAA